MAGIAGPMAVAVWIPTTATCSGNGARAHVAQLSNLRLNGGAPAFQVKQRNRACTVSSVLAYHYARFRPRKRKLGPSASSASLLNLGNDSLAPVCILCMYTGNAVRHEPGGSETRPGPPRASPITVVNPMSSPSIVISAPARPDAVGRTLAFRMRALDFEYHIPNRAAQSGVPTPPRPGRRSGRKPRWCERSAGTIRRLARGGGAPGSRHRAFRRQPQGGGSGAGNAWQPPASHLYTSRFKSSGRSLSRPSIS